MLRKPRHLRNEKGMATIELIPILVIIAILINFSLGFFGVIQTGILNSIAARNYAFETFRNRTNLMYFHDSRPGDSPSPSFKKYNSRVHGIASENRPTSGSVDSWSTLRPIGFGMSPDAGTGGDVHEPGGEDRGIFGIQEGQRNDSILSAPVWIRPMYGICLNAKCTQ